MHHRSFVSLLGVATVLSACSESESSGEHVFRVAAVDADGDGIPDEDDPFPTNAALPGVADLGIVYAHTASTLYTVESTAPHAVTEIGPFMFPERTPVEITDLAIDRWGVLYAISFDALFACNPATAECYQLVPISDVPNGLAVLPVGTLDPDDDTIVASGISGTWSAITLDAGVWTQTILGDYGPSYASSGDVAPLGGATYGTADVAGRSDDELVSIDPATGVVVDEVLTLVDHPAVFGLAQLETELLGFDANGDILLIDPAAATVEVVATTPHLWYGAASRPALPPPAPACVAATGRIVLADRSSIRGTDVLAGLGLEVGVCGALGGSVEVGGDAFLRGQPWCPVHIDGDLTLAGSLSSQGDHQVITGTLTTGAAITPATIGTRSVVVGTHDDRGCTRALAPADYGDVETYEGCTLTLSAGVYRARAFRLYAGASLHLDTSNGPVELDVEQDFAWHDRVAVRRADGSEPSPDELVIYSNQAHPVRVGTDARFVGRLTAPFAPFSLAGRSRYLGCVEAVDISLEPEAELAGL